MRVADKTLYWWSVHLERFLKFCRSSGPESSEIPEVAVRLFLESLPVGGSGQDFARRAGEDGVGCFKRGDGGVVVRRRSVWAGGAEIPAEGELNRIDHRGQRGHGGVGIYKTRSDLE